MALAATALPASSPAARLAATDALLEDRGYAVSARRLGELCLGGPLDETAVKAAAATGLLEADGLLVSNRAARRAAAIAVRAEGHPAAAAVYLPETLAFVRRLVAVAPFIVSVAIAGSLASGGFAPSDDVDLNLVVEDGHRYQAYVVLNALGLLHALRHRGKPVDELTRRPLAPRVMTANLVLERSDWTPLERQDAQMAFELLVQEPVFGAEFLRNAIINNAGLLQHFPQLAQREPRWQVVEVA